MRHTLTLILIPEGKLSVHITHIGPEYTCAKTGPKPIIGEVSMRGGGAQRRWCLAQGHKLAPLHLPFHSLYSVRLGFELTTIQTEILPPHKDTLCTCISPLCLSNILGVPGEYGRGSRAGQKTVWGLHRETCRPDRWLSGAGDLRWVLWLEGLPNTYRYCTAMIKPGASEMTWENPRRQPLSDPIHLRN